MTDTTTGVLAAAIGDHPSVLVVATDSWDTRPYPDARQEATSRGIPWLPVRTELSRVVIGPVEFPGEQGCVTCADLRRRRARRHPVEHDSVLQRHAEALAAQPSSWLTTLAADLVAALVAEEVGTFARTRNATLEVDLATLAVRVHRFLPDPLCPQCGRLPDDSPTPISLVPQRKLAPDIYRVRPVADELDDLKKIYVDSESGLLSPPGRGSEGGLIVAATHVGLRGATGERGYGRTRNYVTSQLIAMLEGLERYGGGQPGGRRTSVRAPYTAVRDQAVDPYSLGLHPSYPPGFRFEPFDASRPYRWVCGYSFARQSPILVPEAYAYYRMAESPSFVYEISNGCALGSSLEEAILYGILEVAERDAFLLTWYAQLGAPRLDLSSARDRTIPLIAEAMHADTGYDIMAFDITTEQGVPCVWVMAVNPADDGRPKVVCAAGSHLDPERATENALSELGPILTDLIRRYPGQRDKAHAMALDSSLVTVMSDHALLYADPSVFSRLSFLTDSTRVLELDSLPQPTANDDLSADLVALINRYTTTGLDVIVVDQTTPEHQAGGFTCVKVLIPGTLSMTFGHTHRRTTGLPRLSRALNGAPVNPHPHPFP